MKVACRQYGLKEYLARLNPSKMIDRQHSHRKEYDGYPTSLAREYEISGMVVSIWCLQPANEYECHIKIDSLYKMAASSCT